MKTETYMGMAILVILISAGIAMNITGITTSIIPDPADPCKGCECNTTIVNYQINASNVEELGKCYFEIWVYENSTGRFLGKTAEIINFIGKNGIPYCEKLEASCMSETTGNYCKLDKSRQNETICACYWYDETILTAGIPGISQLKQSLSSFVRTNEPAIHLRRIK